MKLSSLRIPSFCLALAVMTVPALAQANLEFSGTAQNTCSLSNPVHGTITLAGDLKSWNVSSPAELAVTTTAAGFFELTATRSNAWSVSPIGTPVTTFGFSPSIANGANEHAPFSGVETDLTRKVTLTNAGVDNLKVWISASATQPFKAGLHKTQVTVTCAPK